jgi:hypothetical protein
MSDDVLFAIPSISSAGLSPHSLHFSPLFQCPLAVLGVGPNWLCVWLSLGTMAVVNLHIIHIQPVCAPLNLHQSIKYTFSPFPFAIRHFHFPSPADSFQNKKAASFQSGSSAMQSKNGAHKSRFILSVEASFLKKSSSEPSSFTACISF